MTLFIGLFKTLGLNDALPKFITEFKVKKRANMIKNSIISVLVLQIIVTGIITIVLIIFSDILAAYYLRDINASIIIKILAITLLIQPVGYIYIYIFQGFQRMKYLSYVNLLSAAFVLLISIAGFQFSKSLVVPSLACLITPFFLFAIFTPLFLKKVFPEFLKEKFYFDKELIKKFFKFGIPVMIAAATTVIFGYTDTIMLTFFSGLEQVGLYNVALPTASLLLYLGIAVGTVVLPLTSELWAKKHNERLRKGINLLYKYSFIILLPITLVMILFPQLVIGLLFGQEYVPAAFALRILSIGTLFLGIANINGQIFSGIGKPWIFTKIVLISAIFNIIFNFILIPPYKIAGAAIATSISCFLMFSLTIIKMKKLVLIEAPLFHWFKNFIVAGIIVFVVYLMKFIFVNSTILEAVIMLAISFFVYILLIFLFKLVSVDELKALVKLALKK